MPLIVSSIVEGHGEVSSLPVLLRRLTAWLELDDYIEVSPPIRVNKSRLLNRDDEFRRYLLLASNKCGPDGLALIVLDADDDCPVELCERIHNKAEIVNPMCNISVVLANREYEAWFIASAPSLNGCRGFIFDAHRDLIHAETPRNAKGWIGSRMPPRGYGEVLDQPAFTARMDLQQAFDGSRSFRKLCTELEKFKNVRMRLAEER